MLNPSSPEILGFWEYAQKHPETPALLRKDSISLTYGELLDRVNALSNALQGQGFAPGSVLGVSLATSFEYFEIILATHQIGVSVLPLNPKLTVSELVYILEDSQARGLVVDGENTWNLDQIHSMLKQPLSHIIIAGEELAPWTNYEQLLQSASRGAPGNRCAGVSLVYTSGTSGRPKGVLRKFKEKQPTPEAIHIPGAYAVLDRFDWEPGGRIHLVCGPLYHRASSAHAIYHLMMGNTVLFTDKWRAEETLSLIERFGVTYSHMVPTMLHRLLMLPKTTRERYDVSSLKSVVHAAAPMPIHEKYQILDWWGDVLYEYYAATEGGGTSVKPSEWRLRPGTVGRPWAGRSVEVRDELGLARLKSDQVGTIWISLGDQDYEYLNDPAKTRESRTADMFTAGDLGYLDTEGWLFISDRRSDLIISGGVNIYPAEIEHVIMQHPIVDEVAVVGVTDDDWGQSVKAVISIKTDAAHQTENPEAVIADYCETQLAKFKRPRFYEFRDTLPKTGTGKILRRSLV